MYENTNIQLTEIMNIIQDLKLNVLKIYEYWKELYKDGMKSPQ